MNVLFEPTLVFRDADPTAALGTDWGMDTHAGADKRPSPQQRIECDLKLLMVAGVSTSFVSQ
jgi:hypothetical protein